MKKPTFLGLSILALALAVSAAAAIWGVVTDREGRRRDQPPWSNAERRHVAPDPSRQAKPVSAEECERLLRPDPDFAPGGPLDTGRSENRPSDVARQGAAILGCDEPKAP